MEQELNKYLIADLSLIVLSYANTYRIAMKASDDSKIIYIMNLDNGQVEAEINTKHYVSDRFVLHGDFLYYVISTVDGSNFYREDIQWKLVRYNIISKETTNIVNNKDYGSDCVADLLIHDNILTMYTTKFNQYNLVTQEIIKSGEYLVNPSEDEVEIESFNVAWVNGHQVNGIFEYIYRHHVSNDLFYVLTLEPYGYDKIDVYDYKNNSLVNSFCTPIYHKCYIFSDQSCSNKKWNMS